MAGDAQTGVQIMQMAKGLDTGDILLSESTDIGPADTAATLSTRLSQLGAQMWPRVLGAVEREALSPTPQSGEPTYAHKINKAEARLDWSVSARNLERYIRGLAPFPGAWCEIDGRRVKIHLATVVKGHGEDALQLLSVQPAGKARMSVDDFLRGTDVPIGAKLE